MAALSFSSTPGHNKAFIVGVQLWAVDQAMSQDPVSTLKSLADLGFTSVETAGLKGLTAAEFDAALKIAGLSCRACHASMADLRDNAEAIIEDAARLSATHVVCSSPAPSAPIDPSLPWTQGMGLAMSDADWHQTAVDLNRIGVIARRSGLRLAYHNHDFDIRERAGTRPLLALVDGTDPDLVDIELDVGWTHAGGVSPMDMIRRLRSRLRLVHLKDMNCDPDGNWISVPLGEGELDILAIMAALQNTDVQWLFIEQDPPFTRPVMDDLSASLAFLSNRESL